MSVPSKPQIERIDQSPPDQRKLKARIEQLEQNAALRDAELAQLQEQYHKADAELREWQRWTQGHVWIRREEYADLCELKRRHGPNPL